MMASKTPFGFVDISSAMAESGREVNVIGVVGDMLPPSKSRGSDWMCTFTIADARCDGFLKVRFFKPMESELPRIHNIGDVVIVRNLRITEWSGMIVGSSISNTTWMVFPADSIPNRAPSDPNQLKHFKHPRAPTCSASQIQYVCLVRHSKQWTEVTPDSVIFKQLSNMSPPQRMSSSARARADKFSVIKDLEHENFYDLVGQVIKIYPSYDDVELFITDYTPNVLLHNYEWGGGGQVGGGYREGDEYNYLPRSRKDWPGPYGKLTLMVSLMSPHSYYASSNVRENDFVFLRNVRIKQSSSRTLQGSLWQDQKYLDRVDVSVITDKTDHRVKNILRRKLEYTKQFEVQSAGFVDEARGKKRDRDEPLSKTQNKKRRRQQKEQEEEQERVRGKDQKKQEMEQERERERQPKANQKREQEQKQQGDRERELEMERDARRERERGEERERQLERGRGEERERQLERELEGLRQQKQRERQREKRLESKESQKGQFPKGKRQSSLSPPIDNAMQRSSRLPSKTGGFKNKVVCSHPSIPTRPLSSILSLSNHASTTPKGTSLTLPFQNINSRAFVRVIDFFPNDIADFAVRCPWPSEYDVLSDIDDGNTTDDDSDGPEDGERRWEWRFGLVLECAMTRRNEENASMKVFVADKDAEFLLRLDATNLRTDAETLASLRQKLSFLWGNLEERKSKSGGKTSPSRQAEDTKSPTFECCLKEYGIRSRRRKKSLKEKDDCMEDDDDGDDDGGRTEGGAEEGKDETMGWERKWRMWGTTIS